MRKPGPYDTPSVRPPGNPDEPQLFVSFTLQPSTDAQSVTRDVGAVLRRLEHAASELFGSSGYEVERCAWATETGLLYVHDAEPSEDLAGAVERGELEALRIDHEVAGARWSLVVEQSFLVEAVSSNAPTVVLAIADPVAVLAGAWEPIWDLFVDTSTLPGLRTGNVVFDHKWLPYELTTQAAGDWTGRNPTDRIRDYSWALLLTAGHRRALADRGLEDVPGTAQEVAGPNGEIRWAIRAGFPLFGEVSPSDLRAWHDFLRPLLPEPQVRLEGFPRRGLLPEHQPRPHPPEVLEAMAQFKARRASETP